MKIVIVGGVAGGATAATRIRRMDESAEIIMLERGEHASYSNCSLPYYLSDVVEDSSKLLVMSEEKFLDQYNIDVRTLNEVIEIDRDQKRVMVKDLTSGETYEESYDKLIVSPGAKPIMPKSIGGIAMPHVFSLRNVTDIRKIEGYIDENDVKHVTIVGGGFIGLEVAENLVERGTQVALIEAQNLVMAPFDYDMVQILHKTLHDNGVDLKVNTALERVEKDRVKFSDGNSLHTDMVIMAIGVAPETELASQAGLEIGRTGGIKVDARYRTSDEEIYAIGDAIEVTHMLTGESTRLALAGPAQRQARTVADDIFGGEAFEALVTGTSVVRVFDYNAASTGLNEKMATAFGADYGTVHVIPPDKVGLMPDSHPMHFKLLFDKHSEKVLGAQAIGKGNADKRIDVIATLIKMKGTIKDLKNLELAYSPMHGTAKDVVNVAGLAAENILKGDLAQVPVSKVRELVESGAYIVDVREEKEYAAGHLNGAHNIPLSKLRERMDEIPEDVPVFLHCRTGQRSYNAFRLLSNKGVGNIKNISGGYLGISFFEYFNDLVEKRSPIADSYNFN
ncbi:FAD-dependent oxidoreductase [Lacicoccus alkaliphilus]|uniref:NADPH-dependent 2,4-dienoyl-CoA reductase, sulfur reductase n=1 Tax=Lacicoccus alkaliphilus DSM 16010 TaxID=1123231 RepID=A0A1M7BH54_9BACL|nr:FAD-dependent oxidoreductase [Salinicoccus alkaliphilus]SHL54253.1 NADPH-dependent 2,4-dienoyl-CoA reductase, sulfur reductase [Salinicoccus alkaliphilus DSM 16010]